MRFGFMLERLDLQGELGRRGRELASYCTPRQRLLT